MNKWKLLGAVAVAAALSGFLFDEDFWRENRGALLVALSVVAAGTLVRLARGLPFTNADQYELSEIRSLTRAVAIMVARLRALIIVIVGTMLLLILVFPAVAFIDQHSHIQRANLVFAAAAMLGAMHTYVFLRMYQVVKGDEDLTRLQSDLVERAVARNQKRRFDMERSDAAAAGSSASYGKRT